MSNIIRIRNLEKELKLNNVVIPVDKDNYGPLCQYITILDLKSFILSAYNGDETYKSISESPYWTAGGIIAGDSRFPNGFDNVPVKNILDMMLYPPTTTTTTTTPILPTTTTTTTIICYTAIGRCSDYMPFETTQIPFGSIGFNQKLEDNNTAGVYYWYTGSQIQGSSFGSPNVSVSILIGEFGC